MEKVVPDGLYTLNAQRFLVALQLEKPEFLRPTARELWNRLWHEGKSIKEIKDLKEVIKILKKIKH